VGEGEAQERQKVRTSESHPTVQRAFGDNVWLHNATTDWLEEPSCWASCPRTKSNTLRLTWIEDRRVHVELVGHLLCVI
jgi:hypothetical protein